MSDSTERIKKFLENETNFIRYQITGFEYDRGKRILSEAERLNRFSADSRAVGTGKIHGKRTPTFPSAALRS